MKNSILAIFIILIIASCSSNKNTEANLPKDISERPADEDSQKYDAAQLDRLRSEIEAEIAEGKCTDGNDWTFAPMGSKPCGGPQSYIAYPKKSEATILPKINNYTQKMEDFNKKYNIMSDCMMAMPPSSVKCENGKAVLMYDNIEN